MPKKTPAQSGSTSSNGLHPLAERVQARVAEVGLALDQRARASRPRGKRPRQPRTDQAQGSASQTPLHAREASSLRRVFNELAITHRQFRLRSGQHASPALRDAARAFKEAPSFPSLVVVAAFLEEDGLLEW
ncbi:MAG: hypothetical protein H0T58_12955 [Gemmatimonadales bacterium]|nr:hypothetical protein [Gemmatimonadales bacterium]